MIHGCVRIWMGDQGAGREEGSAGAPPKTKGVGGGGPRPAPRPEPGCRSRTAAAALVARRTAALPPSRPRCRQLAPPPTERTAGCWRAAPRGHCCRDSTVVRPSGSAEAGPALSCDDPTSTHVIHVMTLLGSTRFTTASCADPSRPQLPWAHGKARHPSGSETTLRARQAAGCDRAMACSTALPARWGRAAGPR